MRAVSQADSLERVSGTQDFFDLVTVPVPGWDAATVGALLPPGNGAWLSPARDDEVRRGAPEIAEWGVSLDGLDFAAGFAELEQRLGTPHQILGGPTSVRWWPGDTRQVILDDRGAHPTLRIVPEEWHSAEEMALTDLGASYAPFLWAAELAKAPSGTWFPGSQQPADHGELAHELRRVVESFRRATELLPDRLLYSASVRVSNPDQVRGATGLPFFPYFELLVAGEAGLVTLVHRDHDGQRIEGEIATDLGPFVERLVDGIRAWPHPVEELAILCFARGGRKGDRMMKRMDHRTRFTTLGGSKA